MNLLRRCCLLMVLLGMALPALAAEPKDALVDSMFTFEDYLQWLDDSDASNTFRSQVRGCEAAAAALSVTGRR